MIKYEYMNEVSSLVGILLILSLYNSQYEKIRRWSSIVLSQNETACCSMVVNKTE